MYFVGSSWDNTFCGLVGEMSREELAARHTFCRSDEQSNTTDCSAKVRARIGIASPKLTSSEQRYFVWEAASQSTKCQEILESWGARPSWPPWLRLFGQAVPRY